MSEDVLSWRYWILLQQLLAHDDSVLLTSLSESSANLSFADGRSVIVILDNKERTHERLLHWIEQLQFVQEKSVDVLVIASDYFVAQELSEKSRLGRAKKVSIYGLNATGELWMGFGASNRSPIIDAVMKANEQDLSQELGPIQTSLQDYWRKSQNSIREVAGFQEQFKNKSNLTTILLLVLVVGLFLLEEFWGGSSYMPTLLRMGGNVKDLVLQGEVWRLFTSVFLHAGYLHLFFNGYVLFALGLFFERIFGGAKFVSLYLLSGLCGSLASVFIGQSHLSVGASGALWGLFGASAALTLRPNSFLPEIIRLRMRRITIINIVINLAVSFLPAIDIWAHLGGGVGGFLIGVLFMQRGARSEKISGSFQQNYRFREIRKDPIAVMLSLLLIVSFGFAFTTGKPWQLKQKLAMKVQTVGHLDFALDVPVLLRDRVVQEEGPATFARFGQLPFDPLQIFLRVQPAPDFSSAEEEFSFLSRRFKRMVYSRRLQLLGSVQIEKSKDGYSFIQSSFLMDQNIQLFVFYEIRKAQLVEIEIQVLPDTPENLVRGVPLIFESLQNSGPLI